MVSKYKSFDWNHECAPGNPASCDIWDILDSAGSHHYANINVGGNVSNINWYSDHISDSNTIFFSSLLFIPNVSIGHIAFISCRHPKIDSVVVKAYKLHQPVASSIYIRNMVGANRGNILYLLQNSIMQKINEEKKTK